MGGGRKKRGGFLFRWMRSDLPDREEDSAPVVLLSVKKTTAAAQKQQRDQPTNRRLISDEGAINERPPHAGNKNSNEYVKPPTIQLVQPQQHRPLLTQLNERFRKTLSLDSRSSNRINNSAKSDNVRPKSMVVNNVQSSCTHCNSAKQNDKAGCCSGIGHIACPCVGDHPVGVSNCKEKVKSKSRFRPKSFFSLENFLDSRRSDASSADDFSSSKYRKFYLDSAESSPVFRGRTTPDLLDVPAISSCSTPAKVESNRCKKRLDKLENHFNRVRDLRNSSFGPTVEDKKVSNSDEEPLYSEPFYSSHSTLVVGEAVNNCYESLDSVPDLSTRVKFQGFDDEDRFVKNKTNERDRFLGNCANQKNFSSNGAKTNYEQDFDNFNGRNYDWRRNIRDNSSTPSYEIHIKEDDVLINDRTRDLVVKTMDKSVDSIGSCSLDVDADNTDYSDTTSGSLNILTPSAASCQRDFTSRLQDRACRETLRVPQTHHYSGQNHPVSQPKKPSYLHLACSVNGYSNITTYDSKLRQKLNKSREASPGRPGNTVDMLRDCTDDAMAQRLNSSSSSTAANQTAQTFFKTSYSETSISSQNILTFSKSNGNQGSEIHQASKSFHLISNGASDASPSKSFIQQRVERLYGPGALAQGFFNQQRQKTKSQCEAEQAILNGDMRSPELVKAQNQQNSYLYSHSTFNNVKKNGTSPMNGGSGFSSNGSSPNCDSSLPVLRHLRPEFRAQLPMLSPKRSLPFKIAESNHDSSISSLDPSRNNAMSPRVKGIDVVDRALAKMDVNVDRSMFDTNVPKEKSKHLVTIVPMEICTSRGEKVLRNGDDSVNSSSVGESTALPPSDITSDRLLTTIGDQALKTLDNNCNRVSVPMKSTENKENVPLVNSRIPVDCVDLNLANDEVQVQGQNGDALKIVEAVEGIEDAGKQEEHDGHYFLELKRAETERLIKLAESAECDLEKIQDSAETNEEVLGFLRSAAGKARLLATQKMQQFEGLCHNNLNRRDDEPFPTTCQDLQGFWDMVSLQVEDITQLFKQLETIREGGWKEVPSQKKQTDLQPSLQAKPSSSQTSKTRRSAPARIQRQPEDAAKAKERDERRRNMMAEARKKAAEKNAAGSDLDIQVFESASKSNNFSS